MNDLTLSKANCWNERIKMCMDESGYTQITFTDALNKRYNTKFGQKDVSRWIHTGSKRKKGVVGFPKYETMVLIADFFGKDVGFLTGETDNDSFSQDKVCAFMGLNKESIKAITKFTQTTRTSLMAQDMVQLNRDALNKFLSSGNLSNFLAALADLYEMSSLLDQSKKRRFSSLDEEFIQQRGLSIEEEKEVDRQMNLSYSIKVAVYELNAAFTLLIDEIFLVSQL